MLTDRHMSLLLIALLWAAPGCDARAHRRPAQSQGSAQPSGQEPPVDASAPAPPDATCRPQDPLASNGLAAELEADRRVIAAGDDLLVAFTLALAAGPDQPVVVWDSKYSEGYRSWWFEVQGPAGDKLTLRRDLEAEWDKNAPHPVLIAADQPYQLIGWGMQHGVTKGADYYFSLNRLGLDTHRAGDYAVTGYFAQAGGPLPARTTAELPGCMWGGRLVSATVTITVR